MSDPIWETVCKLKSNCSSRVITFSPPHSLIHITKSRNIFLTICILLAGDIHMNPVPSILQNIRLATKYPRSVHNKSDSIIDLIISKKSDILAFTETLVSPHDTTSCISDICPTHSSFCLQPHHFRCGGCVGSVVSNKFKVTSRFLDFSLSALTCLTVLLLVTSYVFMTLLE